MTEKKKRIVTRIGNVFCAMIDEKYKMYFQFIAMDKSQLNSDIIRVFKKKYALDENPKLEDVVKGEIVFYVHLFIAWGIKRGLWEKVGNVRFEEQVRLPFKSFNDIRREILDYDWRIWYNNEPAMTITGPLPDEFLHAEWGSVISPDSVFKRMRDGKYSGYLARYDKIMTMDRSFEEKRLLFMKPTEDPK